MVWRRPPAWGLAGLRAPCGHQHRPGTEGCREAVPTGTPLAVPSGPVGSAITCHHTELCDATSAPVSVPLRAPGPKLGDTLSPKALQCPDPSPLIHCTRVGDTALQWCNPDLAPSSSSCCPTVLAAQHRDGSCTPPRAHGFQCCSGVSMVLSCSQLSVTAAAPRRHSSTMMAWLLARPGVPVPAPRHRRPPSPSPAQHRPVFFS